MNFIKELWEALVLYKWVGLQPEDGCIVCCSAVRGEEGRGGRGILVINEGVRSILVILSLYLI